MRIDHVEMRILVKVIDPLTIGQAIQAAKLNLSDGYLIDYSIVGSENKEISIEKREFRDYDLGDRIPVSPDIYEEPLHRHFILACREKGSPCFHVDGYGPVCRTLPCSSSPVKKVEPGFCWNGSRIPIRYCHEGHTSWWWVNLEDDDMVTESKEHPEI